MRSIRLVHLSVVIRQILTNVLKAQPACPIFVTGTGESPLACALTIFPASKAQVVMDRALKLLRSNGIAVQGGAEVLNGTKKVLILLIATEQDRDKALELLRKARMRAEAGVT
jgi:hypothetical protein